MVNYIWVFFILISIFYSILTGNMESINNTILISGKKALDLMIEIFPVMTVWLGLMSIASSSGLLKKISNFVAPILGKLFPEIPKGHESLSYIASNIVINMFGLGSAATPFGLKAMKSLNEINDKKDTASRSMITFLVLNTSGVTIIPTMIISMRIMYNSYNPTLIVIPCLIATSLATIGGLLMDRYLGSRK